MKKTCDQFKALLQILYQYKNNTKQLDSDKTASKLAIAIVHYLEDYCTFECIHNQDNAAFTLSKGKQRLDMQIVDNDGNSPSWYIYPSNMPLTNTSIILYLIDQKIINI